MTKLKRTVASLDEVPEAYHEAYEPNPKGTGFRLAVDGIDDLDALTAKQAQLADELRTAKKNLAKFDGVDAEKAAAALAQVEQIERERAEAKGDFDALKKQMAEQHAKEKGEWQAQLGKRDSFIHKLIAENKAKDAITAKGASVELLLPHVLKNLEVQQDGDDFVVRVMDGKQPRVGSAAGDPMTVEQLVEEYREKPAFMPAFPGRGNSGGGAPHSKSSAAVDDGGRRGKEIAIASAQDIIDNVNDLATAKLKPVET